MFIGQRALDFIFALIGLIVFMPFLVLIYLFSKLIIGNPLFIQDRIGMNQRRFKLIKFRTMPLDTPNIPTHENINIEIHPYGVFLRKYKLDELPQIFNVLFGHMSFVGPRPCLPSQKKLIFERESKNIFSIRPGITGLAQIKSIDMSNELQLASVEQQMIKNFNLLHYFKYIALTILGRGRGDSINL